MSNLKGIIIDAGHGGKDPGAVDNNYLEKDLTLLISKYMYQLLINYNIPVYMTRDSDITLSPNERINLIKNKFNGDGEVLLISNHINAGGGKGVEIIYSIRNNSELSNMMLNRLKVCDAYIRKSYSKSLSYDKNKDYYFILRESIPYNSLIIEYAFIDNKEDITNLINNYKCYVNSIVDAILDYYNINIDYYTVVKGDTLWSIAKKYNTTVDKLKDVNNLKSDVLSIGQKLLVNNRKYIVKKGDTLWSISKKFNTTVSNLKKLNNLDSNLLSINQELLIK